MAFTVRTIEVYLDRMEVSFDDQAVIINRTRSFENGEGWVAGGNLDEIFQGYPDLREQLDQQMFNELVFADPSLLTVPEGQGKN